MSKNIDSLYENVKSVLSNNSINEDVLKHLIDYCLYKYFLSKSSLGESTSPQIYEFCKVMKKELELSKNYESEKDIIKQSDYYKEISNFFNN